jgi:Tat protein secretion system quality control protein TatD with DNase activity
VLSMSPFSRNYPSVANTMIIDCHTHLGRNEHIKSNVNELLASMDASKIDKSLVFAGELNNVTTPEMLAEIEPHRDRLYGVASWNFDFKWANCEDYGVWALGTPQATIFGKLYQAGLISAVKFYTGYDHEMPGGPLITRALEDTAEVCYKNKNVYTDISGFVYKNFETEDKVKFKKVLDEFLDIASSDKLLFGTDSPISNQRSYIEALDWVATNTTNKKVSETLTPQYMTQNTIRAFKLKV